MATTIPIMPNWEVHNDLTPATFMEAFKNFAVTAGWTVQTWEPNKQWLYDGGEGLYGFRTPTDNPGSFLEIRSAGYGSQNMQFRFLGQYNVGGTWDTYTSHYMYTGGFIGTEGYDYTHSTHPVDRADGGVLQWNNRESDHMGGVMPAVWFFGDEKRIIVVKKFHEDHFSTFWFGAPVLYDPIATNMIICGSANVSYQWWNNNTYLPFDARASYDETMLAEETRPATFNRPSFYCGNGNTSCSAFYGPAPNLVLPCTQNFSMAKRRPIIQQSLFRALPDTRHQEFGLYPVGRIQVWGYKMGQKVRYGTEEYLVFPKEKIGNTLGIAVRVA